MSSSQIVLFDLATRPPCKCWSLNPWKTRLLFNFKGLDYRTEWTEYPDIKLKLQNHFPLPEGESIYTIPTIRLSDGTYIMDSMKIAKYVEEKYPTPSLHLDSPLLDEVIKRIVGLQEVDTGLRGVFLPLVPHRLLSEKSTAYWMETRPKRYGPLKSPTEDPIKDKAWENSAQNAQEVSNMLKENTSGPFFMGDTVSYADFYWAAYLLFWKRIGDDVFDKLLEITGDKQLHLDFLKAIEPWSKRDGH